MIIIAKKLFDPDNKIVSHIYQIFYTFHIFHIFHIFYAIKNSLKPVCRQQAAYQTPKKKTEKLQNNFLLKIHKDVNLFIGAFSFIVKLSLNYINYNSLNIFIDSICNI